MRAKIDENMPVDAVQLLAAAGWDASTVHDEDLVGASDLFVSAACQAEDRVLISLDLDFADIRMYPPEKHPGIVVLRPVDPDRDSVLALLATALPVLAVEPIRQRLWIVEPDRIRIRSGSQSSS
jgi:predicted nuclease of predicted toxin-antitoxin system